MEWKSSNTEGPNIEYMNSEQSPAKGHANKQSLSQTQSLEVSAGIKEFPCFEYSAE